MSTKANPDTTPAYRELPSVDQVLRTLAGQESSAMLGSGRTADLIRQILSDVRKDLARAPASRTRADLVAEASARLNCALNTEIASGTRRVVNATGVVIHTNLGRAPLSDEARRAVAGEAVRYTTLEYDVSTGKRGRRGRRSEDLIGQLTGAQDALVVNNCAAAAFFVLNVFAAGGEVIISRGELVEIGGDFRVPDVLVQSGATFREVGTTNRTKLIDYERAVRPTITKAILRVHPSNYRIIGFTARPTVQELGALAKKHKLLMYEDIGSGALTDLSTLGITEEPVVANSLRDGAALVTFSGDKLLGGPQSGIIAGRKKLIEQLRSHPLFRILRPDKMTYAALEATLLAYARGMASEIVPVQRMLSLSDDELKVRADRLARQIRTSLEKCDLTVSVAAGSSAVGGGSAAGVELRTWLITIAGARSIASKLEKSLRMGEPAVIGRIAEGRLLLDLRTVFEDEEDDLKTAIIAAAKLLSRASAKTWP